jgi:hypothetical protein
MATVSIPPRARFVKSRFIMESMPAGYLANAASIFGTFDAKASSN